MAHFASLRDRIQEEITMARVCQVSGKKANNAKHIRHRHSGQWKFRAPKKSQLQQANLKSVKAKTEHDVATLTVATYVLNGAEFSCVVSGIKPVPKAWLKKPSYD